MQTVGSTQWYEGRENSAPIFTERMCDLNFWKYKALYHHTSNDAITTSCITELCLRWRCQNAVLERKVSCCFETSTPADEEPCSVNAPIADECKLECTILQAVLQKTCCRVTGDNAVDSLSLISTFRLCSWNIIVIYVDFTRESSTSITKFRL